MGEKVAVLVDRAALGREVNKECGQRLLHPGPAIDNQELWLSFFFSSRRRHTRWNCDWSSDVCPSDLRVRRLVAYGDTAIGRRCSRRRIERAARSEERRVGKECRSRWAPYDPPKKA